MSYQSPPCCQSGYTLIELVVFMVVVAIAAAGILLGFNTALTTYPEEVKMRRAMEIATTRLEYVAGQAKIVGFNSFADNCSGSSPDICDTPSGYSVSTTISNFSATIKTITVDVSGDGYASATTAVAQL